MAGKVRVAAVDCTESAATCQVSPQCRRMCIPPLFVCQHTCVHSPVMRSFAGPVLLVQAT